MLEITLRNGDVVVLKDLYEQCFWLQVLLLFLATGEVADALLSPRFMSVPFLFELRTLMDWIWTNTSMSISDWVKMEDIFSHIFRLKVCHCVCVAGLTASMFSNCNDDLDA